MVIRTHAARVVFFAQVLHLSVSKVPGSQQTGAEERSVRPITREFTNRLPREQKQGYEERNRERRGRKVEQYIPITCDREWLWAPGAETAGHRPQKNQAAKLPRSTTNNMFIRQWCPMKQHNQDADTHISRCVTGDHDVLLRRVCHTLVAPRCFNVHTYDSRLDTLLHDESARYFPE